MRLLFLGFLGKTLHETAMGIDLADQLRGAGVDSCFIVDEYSADQLRAAGYPHRVVTSDLGDEIRTAVGDAITRWRPDALVLSDFMAFWTSCRTGYGVDPWFVDAFNLPIIPIDPYDMGGGGRQVELLGRLTPIGDRITTMPRLRPVPSGHLTGGSDDLSVPYRATTTVAPLSDTDRQRLRRSLGVGDATRLLMIPTLPWQETMLTRAGPATRELATRVPELVVRYLNRLPADTEFLVAGPAFGALGRLPADRLHLRPGFTASEYLGLLGASDAVLALSAPSFALERAVWTDTPGVLALNTSDVTIDTSDDTAAAALTPGVRAWLADYPGTLPGYHAWPLRWNDLIGPLLQDNPFTRTVRRVEILDEEALLAELTAVLHDDATRTGLAQARAAYRRLVNALPDTVEAFSRVAAGVGLKF